MSMSFLFFETPTGKSVGLKFVTIMEPTALVVGVRILQTLVQLIRQLKNITHCIGLKDIQRTGIPQEVLDGQPARSILMKHFHRGLSFNQADFPEIIL